MKEVLATVLTLASLQVVPPTFVPARYRSGSLPVQPPQVVAGGQVLLEVKVGNDGKVLQAVSLRSTPPFTELLLEGVRLWRFEPAEYQGEDVESAVLLAGLFRPPTLMGPTAGEPPQDIGTATDAIPVPYSIVPPDFPPGALADAVVLVEALVERDGTVKQAHAVRSVPGFDDAAAKAAVQWKFRPARRDGVPVPSFAYIVFGFRQPVTPPRPR
ncbi:MAG TPA: energy transducer TonB [Vicinamibacteria bacterium]|nr:energy transducer TonB [Vicinamibacteria bacterium]